MKFIYNNKNIFNDLSQVDTNLSLQGTYIQGGSEVCKLPSLGGIVDVWYSSRSYFGNWYYSESSTLLYSEIIGHSGNRNIWYRLPVTKNSTYSDSSSSLPVPSYNKTLSLFCNKMNVEKLDVFERMILSGDAIFLILDANGTYWLVGEEFGTKVSYTAKTDTYSGLNDINIVATAIERGPIRTVDANWIEQWLDNPDDCVCLLDLEEVCETSISILNTLPLCSPQIT